MAVSQEMECLRKGTTHLHRSERQIVAIFITPIIKNEFLISIHFTKHSRCEPQDAHRDRNRRRCHYYASCYCYSCCLPIFNDERATFRDPQEVSRKSLWPKN
jgi:hypothetical protein